MPTHRPSRSKTLAVLLLGAGLAIGCAHRLPSTLPEYMYAHFGQVGRVQTAVILGDLDAARRAGSALAQTTTHPDLPEEGREALVRLRWHAGQVSQATSVGTAAMATASMAGTCGECHAAVGGGPRIIFEESVPEGETTGRHMMRHLWAADRLWEGLIGPSDRLWTAGADALGEEPIDVGGDAPPEARAMSRRVHELGGQARSTRTQDERVALYGELLNTCAACHTATRR